MTNESTEQLERFLTKFRKAGQRRAKAEADYEMVDHQRKVVLAAAMKDAEAEGFSAVSAQEREARVSGAYTRFLEKLYASRMELELARAEVEYLRMSATLSQTRKANERAEMSAYGGT